MGKKNSSKEKNNYKIKETKEISGKKVISENRAGVDRCAQSFVMFSPHHHHDHQENLTAMVPSFCFS